MAVISACSVLLSACLDRSPDASLAKTAASSTEESFIELVGSLHEHSGFSDGTIATTPADYFAAGQAQGLAFVGSSEHSDNALIPLTVNNGCASPELPSCLLPLPSAASPLAPLTKWDLTAQLAQAVSDDGFTAFRGFEWTSDRFGHINVFFSAHDFNAKTTDGYAVSMEGFYLWFGLPAAVGGGSDGLLVFNHPGREDTLHAASPPGDPAYAYNGFEYRADADARAIGVEVFGKSDHAYDTDNNAPAGGWYAFALDQGWHLGPVGAEDEHGTEWAQPTRAKTVLLARDRSVAALREAMEARRFYALAQNKNALRLSFSGDGQPMGSRLARDANTPVQLSAALTGGSGTLQLVTHGGEVMASSSGSLSQSVAASAEPRWYFLRVLQAERPVAYSAPIWICPPADPACV